MRCSRYAFCLSSSRIFVFASISEVTVLRSFRAAYTASISRRCFCMIRRSSSRKVCTCSCTWFGVDIRKGGSLGGFKAVVWRFPKPRSCQGGNWVSVTAVNVGSSSDGVCSNGLVGVWLRTGDKSGVQPVWLSGLPRESTRGLSSLEGPEHTLMYELMSSLRVD